MAPPSAQQGPAGSTTSAPSPPPLRPLPDGQGGNDSSTTPSASAFNSTCAAAQGAVFDALLRAVSGSRDWIVQEGNVDFGFLGDEGVPVG